MSGGAFSEAPSGDFPCFLDVERVAGGAQRHAARPHERRPSAHPLALSASVDSLRIAPECPFATLAEASVDGGALCEEVFGGLVGASGAC